MPSLRIFMIEPPDMIRYFLLTALCFLLLNELESVFRGKILPVQTWSFLKLCMTLYWYFIIITDLFKFISYKNSGSLKRVLVDIRSWYLIKLIDARISAKLRVCLHYSATIRWKHTLVFDSIASVLLIDIVSPAREILESVVNSSPSTLGHRLFDVGDGWFFGYSRLAKDFMGPAFVIYLHILMTLFISQNGHGVFSI